MTETISRQELESELDAGPEGPVLLEVLDRASYETGHLPGAVSVPLRGEAFDQRVADEVPKKDSRVVVYCQDDQCPLSEEAARRLMQLGYTNVVDYAGGKDDWQQAGLPIEPA